MKQNEWERIKEELKLHNSGIVCFDYENDLKIFKLLFDNIQTFEKPDMFSIIEDYIVPIEHFEFDCGTKNRKGSKFKKDQGTFEKSIIEKIDTSSSIEEIQPINISISAKQYINNLSDVFNNHYKKINSYLDNIKKEYNKFKITNVWFFIEDSLPFVPTYKDKEILLFEIKQFIDILENSANLGGIIYKVNIKGTPTIYMLKNNKTTIINLRKNEIDLQKISLTFPNISIIGLVEDNMEKLEEKIFKGLSKMLCKSVFLPIDNN